MMKLLKVALPITLAVVLVLGVALPGLAASDEAAPQAEHKPRPRMLKGKVVGIDENQEFFTIQAGEREIEIEVNEGTKYFLVTIPRRLLALRQHRMATTLEGQEEIGPGVRPSVPRKLEGMEQAPPFRAQRAFRNPALAQIENRGLAPNQPPAGLGEGMLRSLWGNLPKRLYQFGQEASFGDIAVGGRVVVQVVPRNGNPLAKLVLIMTKPAVPERVVGTILDIDEGDMTITIEPVAEIEDGTIVLGYDGHTVFVLRGTPSLEEGMKAMAIYVETDAGLLAKRVMARIPPPEPVE